MNMLQRLWKGIRPMPRGQALILMYHRIAESRLDPWRLCVSPPTFDRQLGWLRQHCRVVPLRQLAAELRRGECAERTVAITFDDGYADNLISGVPLLTKHGLPATFFLTTAMLGSQREFWWDELERLLLQPEALPAVLHVGAGGQPREFQPSPAAARSWDPRAGRGVHPWEAAPSTRLAFYYTVWAYLKPLEENARQEALTEIRQQLGAVEHLRETHRTLGLDEVRRLAECTGVDVGAHSVSHAALSERSAEQQRWELQQSKRDLEKLIGRPVYGFAYPYGDYGVESAQLALEAGYEFACTTEGKGLCRTTALYLLPRLAVDNWGNTALAWRVRRAIG
jgi:peptidoglycan/xylan/chitin deacetylase (PgdA/CDA1 family)